MKFTWTNEYCNVQHIKDPVGESVHGWISGRYQFTVTDYGRFAEARIFDKDSNAMWTNAIEKTFYGKDRVELAKKYLEKEARIRAKMG